MKKNEIQTHKAIKPTPLKKLWHLSDDDIDIEQLDVVVNADIPIEKLKRNLNSVANTCPQGKQPK